MPETPPPSPPGSRAPRRSRLALFVSVLLAAFAARSTFHEVRRGEPNEAPLDDLFAPFAKVAGGSGPIGVLLEPASRQESKGLVNKLRYALAPVGVSEGDAGQRFVAVWAATDAGRAREVAGRRLREVARTADGFVLYERTGP